MKKRNTSMLLLAVLSLGAELVAGELPRLPKDLDPGKQTYQEQKRLPDLPEAYVSTSPEDLGDGLQVGTLDLPGTEEAVKALIADDKAEMPCPESRDLLGSISPTQVTASRQVQRGAPPPHAEAEATVRSVRRT